MSLPCSFTGEISEQMFACLPALYQVTPVKLVLGPRGMQQSLRFMAGGWSLQECVEVIRQLDRCKHTAIAARNVFKSLMSAAGKN